MHVCIAELICMSVPTKNTFSFTTEYQYRLGDERILSSPGEMDLEVFTDDIGFSLMRDHSIICPTLPQNLHSYYSQTQPECDGSFKVPL